jgi:hypothetical protein
MIGREGRRQISMVCERTNGRQVPLETSAKDHLQADTVFHQAASAETAWRPLAKNIRVHGMKYFSDVVSIQGHSP